MVQSTGGYKGTLEIPIGLAPAGLHVIHVLGKWLHASRRNPSPYEEHCERTRRTFRIYYMAFCFETDPRRRQVDPLDRVLDLESVVTNYHEWDTFRREFLFGDKSGDTSLPLVTLVGATPVEMLLVAQHFPELVLTRSDKTTA